MLRFDSISFGFRNKSIFNNVNLEFSPGKVYGVVGANGVGKTTLFRCISGNYKLKKGAIEWNGKKLPSSHVTFLETNPFFYPYMTGNEYLRIVHPKKENYDNCIRLSQTLNLPLDKLVDTYSNGMKKKIAFIAHYVKEKPICIYDEPFSGVDLESNEFLTQLLMKPGKEAVTFICSHILGTLFEICDEIIHIEEGFMMTQFKPVNYDQLRQNIRKSIRLNTL